MQSDTFVDRFMKAGIQVSDLDGPEFVRFLESDTDWPVSIVRKIGLS